MTTLLPKQFATSDRVIVTAPAFGLLLLVSVCWVTVCLATWLANIVISGGGFGSVNMLVVGLIAWGPPFGALSAGLVAACLVALGKFAPPRIAVITAAAVGWAIALAVWIALLGVNTFSVASALVTAGVL